MRRENNKIVEEGENIKKLRRENDKIIDKQKNKNERDRPG